MRATELYKHQKQVLRQTEQLNRAAIKGFEGLYEVDTSGRVFSIVADAHRRKRELKQYSNEAGYMKVNLYDLEGQCKKKYIHRLVAEAFIPNPQGLKEVNHIDCNKLNNSVENLEWCDRLYNLEHSYKNGLKRRGELHGMHKLTELEVRQIRQFLSDGVAQTEIARSFHVAQCTISAIKAGRLWKEVM